MNKIKFRDQKRIIKQFLLLAFLFLILFYVLFPASISKLVGKPAIFLDWHRGSEGGDYIVTYVASKSLLDGHNIYLNNSSKGDKYKDEFAGGEYSRYSYPPLQAFILSPLSVFSSVLSSENSFFIWSIISNILILGSIFLVSRLVKYKNTAFVFLTLFYGLSSFFWFHLERGQTDSLLLFFMSLSIYLYIKKRTIAWAALFFSLAILLKAFLIALVPFFVLRKEYRFLLYTFVFSLGIIFVTGFDTWSYWLFTVLPNYGNYYLGREVDHSLAYLISGFWDKPFPQVVNAARVLSALLILLYMVISYLNKNKSRSLVLIELATLSIIAVISAPWSANYKLVTLILLFAAPFFILEIKAVKNRILLTIPLLVAFVFLSPIYNEFYGRFLFSVIATNLPGEFVAYLPIYRLAEFHVSAALLFCLFYLLALQAYIFLKDKSFFQTAAAFMGAQKVKLVAALTVLLLIGGSLFVWLQYINYQKLKASYREVISSYGKEEPISEELSLVGYDIKKKSSGSYDLELIIKVNKEVNRHLTFYIHGYALDQNGTEGEGLFPYVMVNFWPSGKYVVTHHTLNFTARPQNIAFGLFDLSNSATYGDKIYLGVINLNELK